MSLYVVDVEADGPCPGLYSMISFGVVRVDAELKTTFKGLVAPISEQWIPEAAAVSNVTRQEHLAYPQPKPVMEELATFLKQTSNGKPIFLSDNPAFDWQWINYYFHAFTGQNPFGFSARRIGDFYAGLEKDFFAATKWKHLRKTKHTHDPVDDAKGNAEALIAMSKIHKIRIPLG